MSDPVKTVSNLVHLVARLASGNLGTIPMIPGEDLPGSDSKARFYDTDNDGAPNIRIAADAFGDVYTSAIDGGNLGKNSEEVFYVNIRPVVDDEFASTWSVTTWRSGVEVTIAEGESAGAVRVDLSPLFNP